MLSTASGCGMAWFLCPFGYQPLIATCRVFPLQSEEEALARMESSPFITLEDVLYLRSVAEARLRSLLRSPLADVATRRKKPHAGGRAGGYILWMKAQITSCEEVPEHTLHSS